MLSYEENEAIEDLKEVIDLYNEDCLITTDDDIKSIDIVLNLIEKQSKKIEILNKNMNLLREQNISYKQSIHGLKEMNKKLEEKLKIAKQLYNNSCICIATDCVKKDKIKEKIEELKKYSKEHGYINMRSEINVLQSLLEEEE